MINIAAVKPTAAISNKTNVLASTLRPADTNGRLATVARAAIRPITAVIMRTAFQPFPTSTFFAIFVIADAISAIATAAPATNIATFLRSSVMLEPFFPTFVLLILSITNNIVAIKTSTPPRTIVTAFAPDSRRPVPPTLVLTFLVSILISPVASSRTRSSPVIAAIVATAILIIDVSALTL